MKVTKELFEKLSSLDKAIFNEDGKEMLNPIPMEIHPGLKRPPTLKEQIQRVLKGALSQQADAQNMETFDECNDFDVDEDPDIVDLRTPYEIMAEEIPETLAKAQAQSKKINKSSELASADQAADAGDSKVQQNQDVAPPSAD